MDEEPEDIEICIDAMQANYLRTLPLHSTQEEIERNDDYSIFRYYMVPSFEFMQELRKFGSAIKVLSPGSLKNEFIDEAGSLYTIYTKEE
jgi:predicted DNA-binding transcriptional regulator YafY